MRLFTVTALALSLAFASPARADFCWGTVTLDDNHFTVIDLGENQYSTTYSVRKNGGKYVVAAADSMSGVAQSATVRRFFSLAIVRDLDTNAAKTIKLEASWYMNGSTDPLYVKYLRLGIRGEDGKEQPFVINNRFFVSLLASKDSEATPLVTGANRAMLTQWLLAGNPIEITSGFPQQRDVFGVYWRKPDPGQADYVFARDSIAFAPDAQYESAAREQGRMFKAKRNRDGQCPFER